ncbi:MAG: Gfo/Idh/MocA family oxidoreductase [Verrucomicrobia bacterium]|nr:Gfo/Idh/MocA family oxidoreductase [Verrucomicrobiota bacterium]
MPRRSFLRVSAAAAAGLAAGQAPLAITGRAAPNEPIRVGLIGCGGRGAGALFNALGAATRVIYPAKGYHTENVAEGAAVKNKDIRVIALADLFPDRLENVRAQLARLGVRVPEEMCFTGFDAYKKLLAVEEINYVIQATPPHFRPAHVLAAVKAGKNVFMEKPAAVDAPGVRMILEAGKVAASKGLSIVAGTQRRHQFGYIEMIKRIHAGELGRLMYAHCYWNGGVIWVVERQPGWSDMEWQLRNWNYFTWLSGDHIVEQHVHNLDVMNWALRAHPLRAHAMGGRLCRRTPIHGHIYDHFAVSFEYPDGVMVFSQCRQMNGAEGKVEEHIVGTEGEAYASSRANYIRCRRGRPWRYPKQQETNPYEQEHQDLIRAIRSGKPLNEARAVAESTLTGIMGRESAYSGQSISWDQALNSKRRWGPTEYKFGPLPFPPVAKPGQYRFV